MIRRVYWSSYGYRGRGKDVQLRCMNGTIKQGLRARIGADTILVLISDNYSPIMHVRPIKALSERVLIVRDLTCGLVAAHPTKSACISSTFKQQC